MKLLLLFFLLIGSPVCLFAQGQITGTVIAQSDGMPLPGASVIVVGTKKGTTTDFDGNYTLNNVAAGAKLAISYIGYLSVEFEVAGRSVIDVALQSDEQQLDAIILTGYSKERKVDLTGAITVVSLGPVEGQSLSSGSAIQGLQGRVPGLFIEKSGDPTGASSRILIRGVTTLGNNDPLYVIDGVPTVRQEVFSNLSPSVIESVQVLKDASASSIYGARAGNGVIIVTTKSRAKSAGEEKLSISINSNISVLSEKKQRYDVLNSLQRGKALWQANVNDRTDPTGAFGEIYNYDWNGDFNTPVLNSVALQPFVGGDPNVPAGNTDWQDETYETGYVFNNEISVSGGTDKSFHLFNLGYLKNTGILKYTNYDRYTAKLNSNFKLFNDKVRIGVNTQFSTSDETLAAQDVGTEATPSLAIRLAPTIPLFDSLGNYGGPIGGGYSDRNNPVLMQFLNRWDNTDRNTVFGNIFAEIDLTKNLTFRTSIGLDYNNIKFKNIEPRVSNGFITRNTNRLIEGNINSNSLVFTNTLNYNVEIGDHRMGVLVGTESVENNAENITSTADGFTVETEDFFVLDAATGARTNTGSSTGNTLLSQFGKLNYAYANKYLASFTIRRDGSSRFGSDNRYGVFPAATLGWKISKESFMENIEAVSSLKLRAGYGEVGNQNIGDLARFGLFETRYGTNLTQFTDDFLEIYANIGTAYDINGNDSGTLPSGFVQTQAGNSGLKWETTKELNLGVDFGLFNNAISGSFDYFTRETSDILVTPPFAATLGEGQSQAINGATTETKGWELSLNYSKTTDSGFSYTIATNFGAFKDRVTEMPEAVRAAYPGTADNSIIGHSQFSIFGYKTDGLFQTDAEVASSGQPNARLGGLKFVDVNGDGTVDGDDRDFIGNTLPDLEYGIRIDLAYKNFDFSIFGSGVAGRSGQDPFFVFNNFVSGRENAGLGVLNSWTPSNTNTDVPAASIQFNDTRVSDYLFRKNSYFKLRNLQIGYSLPEDIINKWGGMTGLRLYAQGENLFWITPSDYKGADPERTNINNIPVPTTLSFGLNLNF